MSLKYKIRQININDKVKNDIVFFTAKEVISSDNN